MAANDTHVGPNPDDISRILHPISPTPKGHEKAVSDYLRTPGARIER